MKHTRKTRNRWEDHYSRRAKQEKYPARSVYKLKEIQQKYHLIQKGDRVLDLGCAPGSWLLYASEQVGHKGYVVGIDLKPVTVRLPSNVKVHEGDVFSTGDEVLAFTGERFHVVMSDMAPATTGNTHVDSARSFNLSETAFVIAQKVLVPGGSFICKIFQGEDFSRFSALVKASFKTCKNYRPKSTRKASKEVYVIGIKKTGQPVS